jgi:hypothetical protein
MFLHVPSRLLHRHHLQQSVSLSRLSCPGGTSIVFLTELLPPCDDACILHSCRISPHLLLVPGSSSCSGCVPYPATTPSRPNHLQLLQHSPQTLSSLCLLLYQGGSMSHDLRLMHCRFGILSLKNVPRKLVF